jgi:hypothetical protein
VIALVLTLALVRLRAGACANAVLADAERRRCLDSAVDARPADGDGTVAVERRHAGASRDGVNTLDFLFEYVMVTRGIGEHATVGLAYAFGAGFLETARSSSTAPRSS